MPKLLRGKEFSFLMILLRVSYDIFSRNGKCIRYNKKPLRASYDIFKKWKMHAPLPNTKLEEKCMDSIE